MPLPSAYLCERRRSILASKANPSNKWLAGLVLSAALSQTALNLARPLISYKVLALGGDALTVGFIVASFSLLPIVATMRFGRISDEVSRLKPLILLGLLLLALGGSLLSFAGTFLLIALASGILGLGHLAFTIAGQAAIAKVSQPSQTDVGFGWFTAAFAVGQLIGPLLAGIILGVQDSAATTKYLEQINQALLLTTAIALASVPIVLLIRFGGPLTHSNARTNRIRRSKREPVKSILRQPGVKSNILASISLLVTTDILIAFLPLIAEQQGVSAMAVGILLALRAAATIISRLLLSALLVRWKRNDLVCASLLGAAVSLTVLPLVLENPVVAGATLVVAGFFLGLGQPLTMVLIARAVNLESRGAALAIRLLGNRGGQVILPVLGGLAAVPLGPSGALWMACLLLGGASIARARPSGIS